MSVFWFHLIILVILGVILLPPALRGNRRIAIPLLGLLGLFLFHCIYWGEACTICDVSNPLCVIEIGVFWLFSLWGMVEWWLQYRTHQK